MLNGALKLFFDGGPIIMSAIFLCSLIAIWIIIERFIYYKSINKNDDKIIERVLNAVQKGRFDEAMSICETMPTPITNLMRAGISRRNLSDTQIQEYMKDTASLEIPKLERFLTTLGTIASIAPLLGLLGTVTGNMEAFGVIGSGGGLGNMEQLAQGISKALLTTAFGLIVAIPATIFYNHLTNKVNMIILRLEIQANELVQLLIKHKNGRS